MWKTHLPKQWWQLMELVLIGATWLMMKLPQTWSSWIFLNSEGHSYKQLEDQGYFNSGCSRHMTENISYLTDFKEFDGGYVAFGGEAKDDKFWRTASVRTLDNGEIELNATVDGQDKTITEASVRRHLKLADTDGMATTTASSLEAEHAVHKSYLQQGLYHSQQKRKKLEQKLKHKRRRAVIDSSEDEEASLDQEDSPKQERMIKEIDEDENINLVKSNDDEETLAETLVSIKKSAAKDKVKAIVQESEPSKKIKKKEMMQISLDEKTAQRFYEEEQAQLLIDEEFAQQVQAQWMLFDHTMESIRNFVSMESKGQIVNSKEGEGSSKECESLKRSAEEELGQEQQKKQQVEEEIVQQEDVVAKQEESSKKA
nr:hypothetical protein [Tanacetum cinerariifolium]